MSEAGGAVQAPARSLNLVDASAEDLSAMLVARLATVTRQFSCGSFSCGTYSERAAEVETEE